MPGNYSIHTRDIGELLTAAKYVGDHTVHRDNMTPFGVDDYSLSAPQMRATIDPGETGGEILPTSLAGELERLRFAILEMKHGPFWYSPNWGIQDRNADQTVVSNTTLPTAIYSATVQNLHGLDGGLELRTAFDVFNATGNSEVMTLDVLYGGQTLFSRPTTYANQGTYIGVLVHAYTLSRGNASSQVGMGELLIPPQEKDLQATPFMTVDTTAIQQVIVRVTMSTASPSFICTHAHSQLWRL